MKVRVRFSLKQLELLPCLNDKAEFSDFIGLGETHQRSLDFPSMSLPMMSRTTQRCAEAPGRLVGGA